MGGGGGGGGVRRLGLFNRLKTHQTLYLFKVESPLSLIFPGKQILTSRFFRNSSIPVF